MLEFHPFIQCFIHSPIYFSKQTLFSSHYLPGTRLAIGKPDVFKTFSLQEIKGKMVAILLSVPQILGRLNLSTAKLLQ